MTTTTPEAALLEALAVYLRAQLTGQSDLTQSEVYPEWPEPTTSMKLAGNRVVLSVIRAGAARTKNRIGPPQLARVIPGSYPAATFRYELGVVEQPITLGLWAWSRQLRDDVDYLLEQVLNAPYWTTVSPIASTTLSLAAKKGDQVITPAAITDIGPGCTLKLAGGTGSEEVARVSDLTLAGTLQLVSPLRFDHAIATTAVEIAGRRQTAEDGLALRCPLHFNAVGRYEFEGAQTLDSPDHAQMQEWRSIRQGTGYLRAFRDVAGTMQGHAYLVEQASTAPLGNFTATSPTPITKRAF